MEKAFAPFELVEIVGIEEDSRGRSCEDHPCCGEYLKLGDLVIFKSMFITTDEGVYERAIAVHIMDGDDVSCLVGFLPRFHLIRSDHYEDRVAKVTQFLSESELRCDRARSFHNRGMALATFLQPFVPPEETKREYRMKCEARNKLMQEKIRQEAKDCAPDEKMPKKLKEIPPMLLYSIAFITRFLSNMMVELEKPPLRSNFARPMLAVKSMIYYEDVQEDGSGTPVIQDVRQLTTKHLQLILRPLCATGSLSTYSNYTCRVKMAEMVKDSAIATTIDRSAHSLLEKEKVKTTKTTKENVLPHEEKKGKDSPWSAAEDAIYQKTLVAGKQHDEREEQFAKLIERKRLARNLTSDSPEDPASPIYGKACKHNPLPESPSDCSVNLLSRS
jgi:hypothetical protein